MRSSTPTTAAAIPERILERATRLFAARGFDGVSLQDIAAEVGVSKQSLLYHFASKDELRRRVLDGLLARWNDILPRLLRAATSGEGQFEAVVSETVGFFAADLDRARLLVREALDRPNEMIELMTTHVRPWADVVSSYIRKGQEQGRVHRDVDPEAYVATTMGLLLSALAMSDCLAALAPAGTTADEMLARQLREVLRVARSSLFASPTPTDARRGG